MLLVTDMRPGGTPRRIARLARGLRVAGIETFAGCLSYEGPVCVELQREGVQTFACNADGPRDLRALGRLVAHVRRIRPALIHATLFHANVAARYAGMRTRVPVISSTATIEVERRWHGVLERLTARFDRGHIVNSRAVAAHVHRAFRVPRARIHVVPPLVDQVAPAERSAVREELGVAPHEFVVIWAGRFDPVKRVEIVVRCAEIMSGVPARFFLIGDGPLRPEIERLIRLSGAGRRIELLGWRDDARRLMCGGDALVFPSRTEGMPNAVLEAMCAGLAIVASDIPATRELDAGEDRLKLISQAEPRLYAAALAELCRDEPGRTALGRRAAEWAKRELDPAAAIQAVVGVYRHVLDGPGRGK